MNVLVTGGAGYIGSVTVKRLQEAGVDVVVLDNLLYGHKNSINCPLIITDLTNKDELFSSLKNYKFDAVIHLAAYALAGESMTNPSKYFYNNLQGGINLLEFMKEASIKYLIHSSSCSIYGTPKELPIKETSQKCPESVYGETKLMFESIISWYSKLYNLSYINLRYFNAAGASLDGKLGESHNPETHIIPVAIKCAIEGKKFRVFGNNYKTPDGTCIRDYIHIEDLAAAHIQVLKNLTSNNISNSYNLGTGKGYSNLEVIRMIEKVGKLKIYTEFTDPRPGDPPIIYADCDKAKKELQFWPKYSDLKTIIETAYKWHIRND